MLRNIFSFFILSICCFSNSLFGWDEAAFNNYGEPYTFQVIPKEYKFSKEFEFHSQDVPYGRVKSSTFRLRTNYDLADRDGWQATGVTRLFSLGSMFSWAKQIDIYDTEGTYIGMISGEMLTTAKAKYTLYDCHGAVAGYAYVDNTGDAIAIQDPEISSRAIAHFLRDADKDSWGVSVYEPEAVDFRILRIFAAFIVDIQTYLHPDNSWDDYDDDWDE